MSSAASSPLNSPTSTPPTSPRSVVVVVRTLPASTACLLGQMVSKWSMWRFHAGWRGLANFAPQPPSSVGGGGSKEAFDNPSPTKKPVITKKPRQTKKSSSPKVGEGVHSCAACSWNDPKCGFEPHSMASQGKIPLDRKPCGKNAYVEVDDGEGGRIWVCAVHSRPCHDVCSRCSKNKFISYDGGHGKAYLQTGFLVGDIYHEGTCETLLREGSSKLAKLGYKSRTSVD